MSQGGAGGGLCWGEALLSPTHPGAGSPDATGMGAAEPMGAKSMPTPPCSPSLPSGAGSQMIWGQRAGCEPGQSKQSERGGLDSGTWHHPPFVIAGKRLLLLTSGSAAPSNKGRAPQGGSTGDGRPRVPPSAGLGVPGVGTFGSARLGLRGPQAPPAPSGLCFHTPFINTS